MYRKDFVSVISPVYNGEHYVSRLLESVLKQTWNQVEMVLVDDGSEDGTIAVAESFRERFSERGYSYEIVHGEHSCAAAAVSEGLKHITGEFLIWPDSDDELTPDSIEKRVQFLQTHPEYKAVRSLSRYLNASDGSEAARDEKIGDLNNTDLFMDLLYSKTYVCCGCYMLRTESFFDIYPEKSIPVYPVGQNFQMLLPFCYKHKCATIEEELYIVYKRADSHSRRQLTREQEEEKYACYEKLLDDIIRIADIQDEQDLLKIKGWKYERRVRLAQKYNDRKKCLATYKIMLKDGFITEKQYIKNCIAVLPGKRIMKLYVRVKHLLH